MTNKEKINYYVNLMHFEFKLNVIMLISMSIIAMAGIIALCIVNKKIGNIIAPIMLIAIITTITIFIIEDHHKYSSLANHQLKKHEADPELTIVNLYALSDQQLKDFDKPILTNLNHNGEISKAEYQKMKINYVIHQKNKYEFLKLLENYNQLKNLCHINKINIQ